MALTGVLLLSASPLTLSFFSPTLMAPVCALDELRLLLDADRGADPSCELFLTSVLAAAAGLVGLGEAEDIATLTMERSGRTTETRGEEEGRGRGKGGWRRIECVLRVALCVWCAAPL